MCKNIYISKKCERDLSEKGNNQSCHFLGQCVIEQNVLPWQTLSLKVLWNTAAIGYLSFDSEELLRSVPLYIDFWVISSIRCFCSTPAAFSEPCRLSLRTTTPGRLPGNRRLSARFSSARQQCKPACRSARTALKRCTFSTFSCLIVAARDKELQLSFLMSTLWFTEWRQTSRRSSSTSSWAE